MYILAHSSDVVNDVLGVKAACTALLPRDVFGSFEFEDRAGHAPQVWQSDDILGVCRWVIEDDTSSSQLDRIALCGEGEPVVSVALSGRNFRGQNGRHWQMCRGNLALCFYLPGRWQICDWQAVADLQMLPACAVVTAISALNGVTDDVYFKAPNDIVIGRINPHKLAGCLTEFCVCGDVLSGLRFGIGINVLEAPDIRDGLPAACLRSYIHGASERIWHDVFFGVIKSFTTLANPIINRRFL